MPKDYDDFLEKFKKYQQRKPLANSQLKVSIQASHMHYCTPRNDKGPWTHVELGFPSKTPSEAILEYKDSDDSWPTNAVYSWVPCSTVVDWLMSEGFSKEQLLDFGFIDATDGPVLGPCPPHWVLRDSWG